MIKLFELCPGVTLRCYPDRRFKQGTLSLQLVRPMDRREAALNALLPAVLLRGSARTPDLRAITLKLDDLYGAAVGTVVRRVGDYQTTGLCCGFMEDRFALPGDQILEPMIDFLRELLLEPLTENGHFCADYIQSEKRNLLSAIEAQRNDKRTYAGQRLLALMCPEDSMGIPRLGEPEQVQAITPESAWIHYQRILRESRIDLFYVGAAEPQRVADLLKPVFEGIDRNYVNLPPQTSLHISPGQEQTETMDVTQGKLRMGFVTPITIRDPRFAAMLVANTVLGGGMTNKLFMTIREQMSLCYDIGSGYHSSKGIVSVSAGLDFDKVQVVKEQILEQLSLCARGQITQQELDSAKNTLISQLQSVHDSPGAIENYYGTAALSGLTMDPAQYRAAVEAVDIAQVAQAAATVRLHTTYFLRGGEASGT